MARKKKSLSEAVSSEIKSNFNLESFKNKKGLTSKEKLLNEQADPMKVFKPLSYDEMIFSFLP